MFVHRFAFLDVLVREGEKAQKSFDEKIWQWKSYLSKV